MPQMDQSPKPSAEVKQDTQFTTAQSSQRAANIEGLEPKAAQAMQDVLKTHAETLRNFSSAPDAAINALKTDMKKALDIPADTQITVTMRDRPSGTAFIIKDASTQATLQSFEVTEQRVAPPPAKK